MVREIVTGNGRLTVALDDCLTVKDFYYPMVGLENHLSGHSLRIGLWVDGLFSWVGSEWQTDNSYVPETQISRCSTKQESLGLMLGINDTVYSWQDVFLRKVVVHNLKMNLREIRLFFSHDFYINGTDTGDTALFHPETQSIIHYKGQRYFLVNGITDQRRGIFEFTTGNKESIELESALIDAEDGSLSGNPIAQGAVDSVISFKLRVLPGSSATVYYWIACGRNLEIVEELNSRVKRIGVEQLIQETGNYWSAWINKRNLDLSRIPQEVAQLFKTSLLVMRMHVDNGGAVISSIDSSALKVNLDNYANCWPREGAIAVLAFDRAGFEEISRLFFEFCDRTISRRGYFYPKYLPDASPGSGSHSMLDALGRPRLPIQEDETALVVYALWEHFQRYRDMEFVGRVYPNLVIKSTDFLLDYMDEFSGLPSPSYDIWEAKYGVFSATASVVYAAFLAAGKLASVFDDISRQHILIKAASDLKKAMLKHLYDKSSGRFLKAIFPDGYRDLSSDSSLTFICEYGPFTAGDLVVLNTLNHVSRTLEMKNNIGGLARYENDTGIRGSPGLQGNPWFISTLWMAKWHIARANNLDDLQKGLDLISWAVKRATKAGLMSEQINPENGQPVSACPLLWSHAEFVLAVCLYLEKLQKLNPV